jgi:hypothetical protein
MRNSGKPAKATPCRRMHRKLRTPSSSTKKASALFVPLRCSIGEKKPLRPETREDGNAKEQRAQRPFRHHCGKRRGMALLEDRYIRWMPNHRERLTSLTTPMLRDPSIGNSRTGVLGSCWLLHCHRVSAMTANIEQCDPGNLRTGNGTTAVSGYASDSNVHFKHLESPGRGRPSYVAFLVIRRTWTSIVPSLLQHYSATSSSSNEPRSRSLNTRSSVSLPAAVEPDESGALLLAGLTVSTGSATWSRALGDLNSRS